ncbi:toxic anion resistance protein [Falseniella ignava]|uniref:Toxic anion resistance protein n=1 Tax=Falseniella ignava TaxID=137730 RepID=A0A2I1JYX9_9LACT|nr:toxic anion resistance protein [Falseniella ignava]PKY88604.1 toxic anion resistance protein [Falseniella ignava]
MTQPTSNSPQTIEDLIQNPFIDPTHESSQKFDDLGVISNKVITNHQLIQQLPEHRQQQARELAKQINEEDMQSIITYGANAQSQLKDFSNAMLEHIQVKDVTGIGDAIVDLMTQLQQNDPKELSARPNLLQKVFGKVKTSISETTLRYQQISTQIDRVAIRLERDQNELLNDNVMLESFYEKNRDYFEALNVYIAASEVKMQELQEKTIPAALEKAQASQDAMDIQKVNDLNQFLERLDKRTHDLRLTRQLTIQQAPQIRMIQNTNQLLAEKIQASIMTAIPLWENQITIALAILRQQNAAVSQQMVSDTTNNLLLKNSEMLKQSTIDVAREAERGVIDIETLRQTQNNLLSALSETLQIQQTGRQQRIQAETELIEMENDLRNQLLSITQNKQANH